MVHRTEDETAGRKLKSRTAGRGWNSRQRMEKQAEDIYRIAGRGLNSRQ
jgi:hypothetical protein